MKAADRETLWRRLCDAGLTQGEMPASSTVSTPWYVRAMLGIAGWIGAWFLLGALGGIFMLVFQNAGAALAMGLAACGAAYAIFRIERNNDFISQFGLAVSFAGQILVVVGLFNLSGERFSTMLYLAIAIFEAALVVLIANFAHRVWSTLAAAVAISFALTTVDASGAINGVTAAVFALIWLNEPAWIRRDALWRPIGYGVALSLLWLEGSLLAGRALASSSDIVQSTIIPWIGTVVVGGVLVYATYRLLADYDVAPSSRVGLASLGAAGAVALATIGAPGVATSLLILIVGFAGGHRVLSGIGILALLGYLSYFYYSLHATLLAKSAVLAGTGIVLIAAWAGMRYLFGNEPSQERSRA